MADITADPANWLRALPAVHELVDAALAVDGAAPRWAVVEAARAAIAARRAAILADAGASATIEPAAVAAAARALATPPLRRVVNCTGVIVHTNLGRAPLAPAAIAAVVEVAASASNLEYDLAAGARGSRHAHAAALLCALTGAEAACVVNNNAAATVLALAALAGGREVIVSRGELVEIGGAFRIPDILALSGATLREVGTTNKTRLADYERAIGERTGMLLKVHRSNFAIVGFTAEVGEAELAALAHGRGLPAMVDLGSGCMLDRARQHAAGLPAEPTVAEVVASGVDVVCFSGDKLLGGPQAGILVGRAAAIAAIRSHPLMRALRPDKLTLAALCATLALYRDGRDREVPVVARLEADPAALRARADALAAAIAAAGGPAVTVEPSVATVGGGAMPTASLASWAVVVAGPADALDARLRAAAVPVIARVADGRVWLDVRALGDDELAWVVAALGKG
ncbi:MAG: L-seryl-tRNA(Sec) selenium transferase [Myxococcales bacterium]|nr:L-seryl-tRNA(Sec) selenium transferase [Myxococcales bacterium]